MYISYWTDEDGYLCFKHAVVAALIEKKDVVSEIQEYEPPCTICASGEENVTIKLEPIHDL